MSVALIVYCRYFFYKNTVFTLVQFWFNLYAAYSGQRLYDDWLQAFYNLLFTSLPVIALGLLDQDVTKVASRLQLTHMCKQAHEVNLLRGFEAICFRGTCTLGAPCLMHERRLD